MATPLISQIHFSDSDTPRHQHYHLSCEMVFVEEGEAEFTIGESHYQAKKNSILFINSCETHQMQVVKAPYRRYFAIVQLEELEHAFPSSVLPGIFKNRPEGYCHCVSLDAFGDEPSRLFARLLEESSSDAPFSEKMVRSLLEQLLILVYRACHGNFVDDGGYLQSSVHEIQRYIETHFTEEIRISQLAEKYYLNHCYLTHKFRELVGYSPKQYILMNRLSYAKELLETTDVQISQVAFQCGFGDVNNFSRSFREWFSLSPKQYRESRR